MVDWYFGLFVITSYSIHYTKLYEGDGFGFDLVVGEVDVQGAVGVAFFDRGERVFEFGQDFELVGHRGETS